MPKSCKSSRGTALYLTSAHSGELLVPFIVHLRWINYRDKVFSSVRTDLEVEQMINKFSINLSRDSPFLLHRSRMSLSQTHPPPSSSSSSFHSVHPFSFGSPVSGLCVQEGPSQ